MSGAYDITGLPATLETVRRQRDRYKTENERLREALCEYASHQSWRCEHAPHYYLVGGADRDPAEGCPCGLDRTLRDLGLTDASPTEHRVS